MKKILLAILLFLPNVAFAQNGGGVNYGVSVSGVVTPNDCVKFSSPWVITDAGTTCGGGGGSGTVTSITAGSTNIVVTPSPLTTTGTIDIGTAVATSANNLGFFSSTTSAQLAGVISDETGTGVLTFATAPTFTTSITDPLVIGGTAIGSSLELRSTSGVGTTDFTKFTVGNNGATEAMRITHAGNVGIGSSVPTFALQITGTGTGSMDVQDNSASGFPSINISDNNGVLRGGIGYGNSSTSAPFQGNFYVAGGGSVNPIAFIAGGSVRMYIATTGGVGIGTTSPLNGSLLDVRGSESVNGTISNGTKFTTSGCSVSATAGGATAGSYTSGTTGACTVAVTMNGATGITAPNGWACSVWDTTTTTDIQKQTTFSTATATFTGTTVSGDVVIFKCDGF